ncbi:phosphatidate cytidylyltransferase [Photobacterium nomapromontoriensis]|uniref:phosphatidate cytidylyltransferase n=1 Tax=Photobacterium nomapromontoriensis TaxID=2910237 RepID=UPI003D141298
MDYFTSLTMGMKIVLGAILAVLCFATGLVHWLKWRHSERDYTELWLRIRSWWVMVFIFCGALIASRTVAIAFFALISYLSLKEYLSIIPTRRADRRVLFWAYLAIPIQFFLVWIADYGLFIIFIPVYMFLLLPMQMVIVGETKHFLRAAGTIHWGLMTMVFSISHLAFLLALPEHRDALSGGAGLVLYLVVLTQFNDVAQYTWGKLLGKRKIIPKVSPNKTWAGFIGGILTTTAVAIALAPLLTPMEWPMAIAAGLIIGIGGFIGDVTISALKRDLQIKDSGNLLPGHGGILDRIDSLTYSAPLFMHFIRYFYYT